MCFYVYEHGRQQMKILFSTSNHLAATNTNPSIYYFLNPLNLEFYNSAVNYMDAQKSKHKNVIYQIDQCVTKYKKSIPVSLCTRCGTQWDECQYQFKVISIHVY